MTTTSAYESLYNKMKSSFTVAEGASTYTIGEYMSMKANEREESEKTSALPVAAASSNRTTQAVSAFFSYVNDKLTVKKEPVKDKTIRAFPFRTSIASLVCALLVCALVFSYGIFTIGEASDVPTTVESGDTDITPTYNAESDLNSIESNQSDYYLIEAVN